MMPTHLPKSLLRRSWSDRRAAGFQILGGDSRGSRPVELGRGDHGDHGAPGPGPRRAATCARTRSEITPDSRETSNRRTRSTAARTVHNAVDSHVYGRRLSTEISSPERLSGSPLPHRSPGSRLWPAAKPPNLGTTRLPTNKTSKRQDSRQRVTHLWISLWATFSGTDHLATQRATGMHTQRIPRASLVPLAHRTEQG